MPVRIVAVDDELGILSLLRAIIGELSYAELVGEAQSAAEGFERVREAYPELVFLDIDLPDMSGLELAEKLKEYDPNLYIVFITGHPEFSLDAYRLYAYDYIVKPIDEKRVKGTIRRIQQLTKPFSREKQKPRGSRLTIYDGDEIVLVDPETILYIEKIQRKATIHTINGTVETSETLQELEERLGSGYYRAHKSYIVSVSKIDRILASERASSYQIKFKNYPYEALLSRNRISELLKKLKSWQERM